MRYKFFIFILLLIQTTLSAQEATYTVIRTSFSTDNFDEYCPVYYRNGIVFCTNNNSGSLVTYSSAQGTGTVDINYIDTAGSAKRSRLFSKSLRTKANDGPVTFNSRRDTIYFSRNMNIEGNLKEISSVRNRLGVFSAVDDGKAWTRIRELRFNNEWYNITSPCLSPDGKRLYFASDMPNGHGGSDLYYCQWRGDYWDDPVNLGSTINTKGNEAYPFVTAAGELFFASDGHPGLGAKDIFYSKQKGNEWLPPVRLDPPVNSQYDDFGLIADPMMNEGYFSSNRLRSTDIFKFKVNHSQIFYAGTQKENNYCFIFSDPGEINVDTTYLQYVWDFGDGKKGYGEVSSHCYSGPGTYNVRLDIIDRLSGNLFFTKLRYSVRLQDYEQPYISSPDIAIAGQQISLSGLQSHMPDYDILSYSWDFGDGTRLEGPDVNITFKEKGEYNIKLGLKIKSKSDGIIYSAGVSKKITVLSNEQDRKSFLEARKAEKDQLQNIWSSENAIIRVEFSAEESFRKDGIFRLQLLSSSSRLSAGSGLLRNLPDDKYFLKEVREEASGRYEYYVEEQIRLSSLYPSFRELLALGFKEIKAVITVPAVLSERELTTLKKNYGVLSDDYFDANGRLKTPAYLMLDQIIILMNRNPEIRMQIEVHTDNLGQAANNLKISQTRAQLLVNYLINRGISSKRLTPKGYGGVKPVASNMYERDRRLNRRVDFRIIN